MTTTDSAAALLRVAIQDLHAGKRAFASRMPALCERMTDAALVEGMRREVERALGQAARLEATGVDVAGPKNLWMSGILDDAERDARTTQPGMLLDIALIGAIRKGKAAEIVSSETAIALARRVEQPALAEALGGNRREEIETDALLRERLEAIADASVTWNTPGTNRLTRPA